MADESLRPVVIEPPGDYVGRERAGARNSEYDIEGSAARRRFRELFRNFRKGNIYIYRDSLLRHWSRKEFFVEVDVGHINEYDDILLQSLQVSFDLIA